MRRLYLNSAVTALLDNSIKMNPGIGIYQDVCKRLPLYWSDWTDAWNYRTIPAIAYMYFAKYVNSHSPKMCSDTLTAALIDFLVFSLPWPFLSICSHGQTIHSVSTKSFWLKSWAAVSMLSLQHSRLSSSA